GSAHSADQSHILKGNIDGVTDAVAVAPEPFSVAAVVDGRAVAAGQRDCDVVRAEAYLQDAFATDVRPVIQEWRVSKGLPKDPMEAFRQSGYLERITKKRAARNSQNVSSYA